MTIGALSASIDTPGYPRVKSSTLLALAPTAPATEDVQDATNSTTSEIRRELLTSFSSGAAADRDNPDPRRGKLKRREVWNLSTGGTLYQAEDYGWKAYWLEAYAWQSTATTASWKVVGSNVVYPITWLKLEKETQTIGTAVNEKRYTYEGSYGNQTQMQEWADSSLQRTTYTDYYPNSSAWIVNQPARVLIYNSAGACQAETRYIYGAYYSGATYVSNVEGNYQSSPLVTALLVKTEQALAACSSAATIATYDGTWAITRMAYDRQGKLTRQTDARSNTTSLYYDTIGRHIGNHFRSDTSCPPPLVIMWFTIMMRIIAAQTAAAGR